MIGTTTTSATELGREPEAACGEELNHQLPELHLSWTSFHDARRRLQGECVQAEAPEPPPHHSTTSKSSSSSGRTPNDALIGPAPIKKSRWLSQLVGGSVWLKLECLHQGGSFKLRGAAHALLAHRDRHQGRLPSRAFTARLVLAVLLLTSGVGNNLLPPQWWQSWSWRCDISIPPWCALHCCASNQHAKASLPVACNPSIRPSIHSSMHAFSGSM